MARKRKRTGNRPTSTLVRVPWKTLTASEKTQLRKYRARKGARTKRQQTPEFKARSAASKRGWARRRKRMSRLERAFRKDFKEIIQVFRKLQKRLAREGINWTIKRGKTTHTVGKREYTRYCEFVGITDEDVIDPQALSAHMRKISGWPLRVYNQALLGAEILKPEHYDVIKKKKIPAQRSWAFLSHAYRGDVTWDQSVTELWKWANVYKTDTVYGLSFTWL